MEIYRITRKRASPSYWQSRTQTDYGTRKKAFAIAKAWAGSSLVQVRIERAQVGEFTDVTREFILDSE